MGGICFSVAMASTFAFQSMMTSARAAPAKSAVDAIASSTLSFIVEGIIMRILLSMNERRAARAARAQRSRKYRPDLGAVCEAVHTGAALAATTRRDGYSILM